MAEILLIPIEDIIACNHEFTGLPCDPKRCENVGACYSSFYFYGTIEEQITSIVVSLAKGHFFVDGNKRTALYAYIMLCEINGLSYIQDTDEQVRIFVDIARSRMDMKRCLEMLFPG